MQKDGSFKHANGAGGKLFEFTPSRAGLPNGVQVDPQGSTARFQGVHIKML